MTSFQERQQFLRDLAYVMKQAAAYRDFYASGAHKQLHNHPMFDTVQDALLESSLAFLRKVSEFFVGNEHISARDYLPSMPSKPGAYLFDESDYRQLTDRVIHLSLEEAKNGKKNWNEFLGKYLTKAEDRYNKFITELRAERPEYFVSLSDADSNDSFVMPPRCSEPSGMTGGSGP